MKIKKFPNMEHALKSVMHTDEVCPIVWHSLTAGKGFPAHREEMDEWIFISNGQFTVTIGDKKAGGITEFKQDIKGPEVMVLHIPKGEKHAIKAHSFISYFVLKSKR